MGLVATFTGNPRQKHQFLVRVDGIDGAWFEKAQIPPSQTEIDEFNPAGSIRPMKFAGRVSFGDCTLEKGTPADESDLTAWNWFISAANTKTGELGDPAEYRKTVEICEVDRVGNVIQTYKMKETFCSQIELAQNEGGSSEHMIETLTLTVGDMEVI